MRRALRPIRRRIRVLRGAKGFLCGLLAGAAACAVLTAVSFFTPIEALWRYLVPTACACPLLGALLGFVAPVSLAHAAKRADACGLQERARTALQFEGEDGSMLRLQRADAQARLQALPVRKALPIRPDRRLFIPAAALSLVVFVLLIVPNPQTDVLRAREQVRKELRAQADTVEKAAQSLAEEDLTEEEKRELRKLTGDMAEEMRKADDQREALSNLDEKQKQLERLQKQVRERIANETAEALGSQSALQGLSKALQSGSTADMQSALAELSEEMSHADLSEMAEQLENAASQVSSADVQEALAAAAKALAAGDAQAALTQLSGALASAGSAAGDISSLLRVARLGVAGAGQGQGQGQGSGSGSGAGAGAGLGSGQGGGSGAGLGSTQRDAGYTPGFRDKDGATGGNFFTDKVGEYERIYDPTRLGDGGEASLVAGQKGEGESVQVELGPGAGNLNGTVPYDQVIGEYQDAAAQAMRRMALPESMQDWVARYFDALIE